MSAFARTDTSLLGRWWWQVDRWMLAAVLLIVGLGLVLTLAASPAVAERLGLDPFHFARRQFVYLPLAVALMVVTSLLSPLGVRRVALVGLAVSVLLTFATLMVGTEMNGATRWLTFGGLSLQPTEFVKPALAVVAAALFAAGRSDPESPGGMLATGLVAIVAALMLAQPDVGMTIVVAAVWGVQLFLVGLPWVWVLAIGLAFLCAAVAAYFAFAHVQSRVDHFLDPSVGDGYQVARALEAFRNGGLFGRGPGEGEIKTILPDAHADFILAVAGEEFGLLLCLAVVGLFAFVVLRGVARAMQSEDLFGLLAVGGLLTMLGLQAVINMASTLHLMPPKGMTLPFVSYGGSSTLALAWAMGMVLALTRERPPVEAWR